MLFRQKKGIPLTISLIAICIVIFIFQLVFSFDDFYFVPAEAFSKPWTFVTSIFLHAGIEHLFFNMIALLIFGSYLESKTSKKTFLLIFFVSGIVGNFGYMFTTTSQTTPGLGASGAIYGIMGTLAVIEPFATVYISYMPMPMIMAAFVWALTEFLGLFVPSNIARGAHLGGLFFGIIYGLYLRKNARRVRL
jgi:membrane associated rhomboid family serine protease